MIRDGFFTPGSEGEFSDLVNMLLHHDRFLTLADYKVSSEKQIFLRRVANIFPHVQAYISSQDMVSAVYRDQARWAEMAIHNIASSGEKQ